MNSNFIFLLPIIILGIVYYIYKVNIESKKVYTLDEVMQLGKIGSLQNGTPIFKVFVKEHEYGKQKIINENLSPGYIMHDTVTKVGYKIKNEIFDLPSEVKNERWFKLEAIDPTIEERILVQQEQHFNFKNPTFHGDFQAVISDSGNVYTENNIIEIINIIEENATKLIQNGIPYEEIKNLKQERDKHKIEKFISTFWEVLVSTGVSELIKHMMQ